MPGVQIALSFLAGALVVTAANPNLAFFHGLRDYPVENVFSRGVLAGDVDEDGTVDLVISGSYLLTVLLNNGSGAFGPARPPLHPTTPSP